MSLKRTLLQLLAACVGFVLIYAYALRFERVAAAGLRLRGDRRWGLLWPLVDACRALGKRSAGARGRVLLGPLVSLALALLALLLLPISGEYYVGGFRLWAPFVGWDPHLLSVALLGMAPALGTWLTGTLSAQKGARESALDAAGHALAYTAPALLALAGAALVSGQFTVGGFATWQRQGLPLALYQPLGLALYALCALLAARRLPTSEAAPQPALLDWHLQHAGAPWAIAHLSEYSSLLFASAVVALVYLGGWQSADATGLPAVVLKTLGVLLVLLWVRQRWYTVRRARPGAPVWRLALVLGAANLLITAVALLGRGGL